MCSLVFLVFFDQTWFRRNKGACLFDLACIWDRLFDRYPLGLTGNGFTRKERRIGGKEDPYRRNCFMFSLDLVSLFPSLLSGGQEYLFLFFFFLHTNRQKPVV